MSNVSMINGHIDESKGLSDAQIIKAMECCASDNLNSCDECPFQKQCENDEQLVKYALALINRKDEIINGLIAGQETLQKHLAEKNAEIERLQKRHDFLNKTVTQNAQKNFELIIEETERAKSEAIKEFAERLKAKALTTIRFGQCGVIDCYDIDNLVKEMEGK